MTASNHSPLSPLAMQLNKAISDSNNSVLEMLSMVGKEFFFPKGILSQSAEAKQKATKYNATIGIATEGKIGGSSLYLPSVKKYFSDQLTDLEVFPYAPSHGIKTLRKAWQKKLIQRASTLVKNSFHQDAPNLSLPIVTAGLTHGLSTACHLFFDADETLITPNQIWGNYRLVFSTSKKVNMQSFEFFNKNRFNIEGLIETIEKQAKNNSNNTAKVLLNFPNNPTGYQLTSHEALALQSRLVDIAQRGIKLLVIIDDAYFNLGYEDNVCKESIFSLLANAHENLLAIKLCGLTKEFFSWGLRVGFITYGVKGGVKEDSTSALYHALEEKTAACIRAHVSNCSTAAQNIGIKILNDKSYIDDQHKNYSILKERYLKIKQVLNDNHAKYANFFEPYPFNAGYFMLIKLKGGINNEALRLKLLNDKQIGVIAIGSQDDGDIRIAFSCLAKSDIATLFEEIYDACKNI